MSEENEAPRPAVEQVQRLLADELSPGKRLFFTLLLLCDLALAAAVASLWLTEPALPPRTHVAFGVLVAGALTWSGFLAWTLTRRKLLLARHRLIAGRLAVTFSAGYVYVLADPGSDIPVIGASGAVAGVVGAYFVLHPNAKVWILAFGRIPLRFASIWIIGFWAGFQVFEAVTSIDDQIAWWAHIGGFLTGALLVVLLRRRGVSLFDRTPLVLTATTQRVDEAATDRIGSAAPPRSEGPSG